MTDIIYPQGCRPLAEDLGTDELIRRLKTLAHTLQAMGQDDGLYQQYIPLALHLVDEFFLQHLSRDVQLLVACCIADVLRVYAPEAPYKDQEQIKQIFLFFIKQLHGLKDPKDPSFKRYFYLLENLAYVKSFNMCFEIEDCQEIFGQLFSMMFKIINDEHSGKVKNFIVDILSPLITEADNFTTDLLDMILINIVEPLKTQNKHAYHLARELIVKTSDSLESVIKIFFNQVLIMDKIDKNYQISFKIYDLIYELNVINPQILCSILPQLECKLKSTNESERHKAVSLLARMFSEKNSTLSKKHPSLLRMFFGRFCDIAVSIRIKCVQSSMHFLLNHPHLRGDIIENLKIRQHDSDETVRYEVVMAIVETAKRDFKIVCESEDLLEFVKERTLDKKFKIRKEAMNGLAMIYKQTLCEPNDIPEATKNAVDWIKNKILHGYYMPGLEDRLLVERLLITCLVPYKLDATDRMKKLYHLLGTLDENATKAFIELQKSQMKIRKTVSDWVKLHHQKDVSPKLQKDLNTRLTAITKLLPDPLKASEFLTRFSLNMRKDPVLLRCMETILKRDVSCKECADTMSTLLKKLGNPIMTNLYYNTVKMLLERIASVMVDRESIGILVGLVENCMQGGEMIEEVGIRREEAGIRGLKLLTVLSYIFSAHFLNKSTMRHMIALMSYEVEYAAPLILKAFTHLGRYKPLCDVDSTVLNEMVPICREFALSGTTKQAKHAVRCIFINTQTTASEPDQPPIVHPMFTQIIDVLKSTFGPNCENYGTKVVCLGHIAYNMPSAFQTQIKNMIARRVVKELLIQGVPESRPYVLPTEEWCEESELPADTLCKLDALKTMARWLLGLKTDEHSAQKTFRMLSAFINQRGDLLEQNRLCPAEKSWLRLTAACSMLKICEQKGVGDQYSSEQYFNLSQLMFDPVREVREIFVKKLHKGLNKGLPNKCLPLDFMGFYALCGHEKDKKLLEQMKHYIESDVSRRKEYMKTIATSTPQDCAATKILPDYMLSFAIPVLAHDPQFTNHEDRTQLKEVEKCLRFTLEPLLANKESFSYGFYKNLIEEIKNHEDTTPNADDNSYNFKMWAICDLSMHIINSKVGVCEGRDFSSTIHLPEMYYKSVTDFQNHKIYIPMDILDNYPTAPKSGTFVNISNDRKKPGPGALQKRQPSLPPNNNKSTDFDDLTTTRNENHSSTFDDIKSDKSEDDPPAPKRTKTTRVDP
ncbi:sister chromatid cohesion protein PDS5 homolog B-A [Eupeodes corollae]|uniref:sister chromatid cohesion protein PDS5 homolog B-A n=1 Tax=Eupeodes corollae TaxID=290404 RepID=UPI00248F5247|nr:sister chromatid cohesion protein PDS5 homolog B-A [Eupeodes corollae]